MEEYGDDDVATEAAIEVVFPPRTRRHDFVDERTRGGSRVVVPTVNPRLCSWRPRISRVAGRTEFTVESVADQVDSWGKQSLEGKRVVADE